MKKSEAVMIGKVLAETYLKRFIKKENLTNKPLDDEVETVGFKEHEDKRVYKMLFKIPKVDSVICEIVCDIDTRRCKGYIYNQVKVEKGKTL